MLDIIKRQSAILNQIQIHEHTIDILNKLKTKKVTKRDHNKQHHYNMMMTGDQNSEEYIICQIKMKLLCDNILEIHRIINLQFHYINVNNKHLRDIHRKINL